MRHYCYFPWSTLLIRRNGIYGPCCRLANYSGKKVPSNVNELMELWNSKEMIDLRRGLLSGIACANCDEHTYAATHDIFGCAKQVHRYSIAQSAESLFQYRAVNNAYEVGEEILSLPPIELYVFHSDICNLHCKMCARNDGMELFPVSHVINLINEIGISKLDRIGFIGGESMVSPDGRALLEYVAQHGASGTCVYLTTNGTCIHECMELIERIDNLFITISIDGIEETYETIRGFSWSKLMDNVRLLVRARDRHPHWRVNINSVVMNSTYSQAENLVDLAHTFGATIFFSRITGSHPEEDFNAWPSLLDAKHYHDCLQRALNRAVALGASKAQDSLRNLMKDHLALD